MLIPNCMSGKDVYILATYTLNRGSGMVGPSPGPSVVLCVCAINSYIVLY